MKTIKLSFLIELRDFNHEGVNEYNGPTFHRFLPNNKLDKLERNLDSLDGDGKISFWFEKRGEKKDGFIKYNYNKKLIEEKDISRQAILDGGVLFGEVSINDISIELLQVLKENKTGDAEYISFGKKVVKETIKHSNNLINIFRHLFRQHWVENLVDWDSKCQSLGSYCDSELSMKYTLDNGVTWNQFLPDEKRLEFQVTSNIITDYSDFILQDDWILIKDLFESDFKHSDTSIFLSKANETLNNGDLKKAFIEAVTALEAAIEYVVKGNSEITQSILRSIQSFHNLPLPSKFSLFCLFSNKFEANDIENSLKAIKIRNDIVHEGYKPKEVDEVYLKSLFKSISKIINEPVCKFPVPVRCNITDSHEGWEKLKKQR